VFFNGKKYIKQNKTKYRSLQANYLNGGMINIFPNNPYSLSPKINRSLAHVCFSLASSVFFEI